MPRKFPIYPNRIRKIGGSFSWIEHRFIHDGFLQAISPHELLLYYFLVTVGDKNGVSFYGDEKICQLLKMDVGDYLEARKRLRYREMIAYQMGIFQVLPLPQKCQVLPAKGEPHSDWEPVTIGEIFNRLGVKP